MRDYRTGLLPQVRRRGVDSYVDFWNLEEEEGISATRIKDLAVELHDPVNAVLATPMNKRGKREW